MGVIRAFKDAVASTFADQWKEVITAPEFDEHLIVAPGIFKTRNMGRGANNLGSDGIISNGSKIFVPENAIAFIFDQESIENILPPGGYEYQDGDESIFNGDDPETSFTSQIIKRLGFGGITPERKRIAFVNMREIRDSKFGTPGAQLYHDPAYGIDLEVKAWGSFSIKVTDPERLITEFVPTGNSYYSVDDDYVSNQITYDFIQSFSVALNSMSAKYRVSQLASLENEITKYILNDENVGSWKKRFGFELVKATIGNIGLTEASRDLLKKYADKKIELSAYSDISQKASDISAQQKVAQGVQDHGFGDMGGMIYGVNMAQSLDINASKSNTASVDQQLEILSKLKKALEEGILTQEEFDAKKKEILGL